MSCDKTPNLMDALEEAASLLDVVIFGQLQTMNGKANVEGRASALTSVCAS